MIENKLSQGAKPGKGGMLAGGKVKAEIAAVGGIPAGQDSISPNRHVAGANRQRQRGRTPARRANSS